MQYTLNNSSFATWNYGMDDVGPTGAIYELDINPTEVRTGVITDFAFPLEWKAENSFGCGVYDVITGPGIGGPAFPCVVPSSVNYNVTEVIPFVFYTLYLEFG
ncbi:MAG: hypothetical protein P1U56_23250 [Saprospiraceae bacterium]|nr:hypothetical protein [Saprospiraceae bacterium]